jgi:hypothetical protein
MNAVISEIEQTLRNNYPSGFGAVFIGAAKKSNIGLDAFKKEIGLELPDVFYEYYEWLSTAKFDDNDVSDQTRLGDDDSEHYTPSLGSILSSTRDWRDIQEGQPDREWKSGFAAIASWNSCYQLAIDTTGEVAPKGGLLYWDFKGGDEYNVVYENFDMFLKTKLELLKAKLYFPPPSSDDEAYDDFMYGDVRGKIDDLVQKLNGATQQSVPFT